MRGSLLRRVALLAWIPFVVHAADAPFELHVAPAPRGNDANNGSDRAPFATLDRARRAVRDHLSQQPTPGPVVVLLHGGTYELAAPVRFEPADSGREGAEIVYRAAQGETPMLSGGRAVSGWTTESNGIFRADVGRSVDFRQLWVGDRRAIRARTPNAGQTLTLAGEKTADGFDLPREPFAALRAPADQVEMAVSIAWMHKRLRISDLSAKADGGLHARINPLEWDAVTKQPQGDRIYLERRYWLENAREFLDAPGEFFLEREKGIVRYLPRRGETLATLEVVRPELENLIILDGRPDAPVHHLRFEGLTFVHTGWTRPNRFGFVDVQANSLVPADVSAAVDPQYRHNQRKDRIPAAFQANTADNISLVRNRFARLGGTGVIFTHGGNDNVIAENSFYDLSADGIELGEDAHRPTDPRLFPRRNRIANNFIAHIGEEYFGSVAILGYYTDASTITHNEIASLPYTAISQGWGWGQPLGPLDARGNVITYNRITNFLRELDDGGGIYTTDRQLGSEVAYNYLDRMTPIDDRKKAGAALYPDQFTEGIHWHDNVVAEVPRWLHLWNPNIKGNRIDATYSDTAAHRNDGPDNKVEAAHVFPNRHWPEAAQKIITQSGLETAAATAREFAAPASLVVDSTGVDFQVLTGQWTVSNAGLIGYAASVHQSTDRKASARWMPVLPRSGNYTISAWRPAGAPAARYVLRADRTEKTFSVSARRGEAGWEVLGSANCSAGARTDLTIFAEEGNSPLTADSIRFDSVQE